MAVTTQLLKVKNETVQSSQLVVLAVNSAINFISIEKTIDLQAFSIQPIVSYLTDYAFLGIVFRLSVMVRVKSTPLFIPRLWRWLYSYIWLQVFGNNKQQKVSFEQHTEYFPK